MDAISENVAFTHLNKLLYGSSGSLAEIIKTVTILTVTDGENGCMKYKRLQQYKSLIICQHSTNY